jgi:protein gp37
VPARVRFVSYEPALGPVDFTRVRNPGGESSFGPMSAFSFGLSWVIAGGESGPRARPAHPDWFRSVRDQCRRAGVPFLFKQWGEWAPEPTSGDLRGERVRWVGKRRAGRELDGVTHDAFPVTQ